MLKDFLAQAKRRRVNAARQIVITYLQETVIQAERIKCMLYKPRSQAYCISRANDKLLYTTKLKVLLWKNDQAVADWVNALPEVKKVLSEHNLMFVYTYAYTYRPPKRTINSPQYLAIVSLGSTNNRMYWPET